MKIRLVGPLLVFLLAATACGAADAGADSEPASLDASGDVASLGDGDINTDDAEAAGEVDTEAQLLSFAECIRGEGFDIDDPTVDSDGNVLLPRPNTTSEQGQGPPEGFVEARDTCAEHLKGIEIGFRGGDQTELQDRLLEFVACMRENDFDLPDPDFSVGGGRGLLQDVDQDDPNYQAAFANCDDILGAVGGGGRAAGGGN